MLGNPRRTRAGVIRPGGAARSQGRRTSSVRYRARRSWVCAAITHPGPPVSGLGGADLRGCPAEGLFEQPEGVLDIEPAQERSPEPIDICWCQTGFRAPQPHRRRMTVTGQVIHRQPDHCSLDDRGWPLVVGPRAAVGQPGVQPIPRRGVRGSVAAGVAGRDHCRFRPTVRVGEFELRAVPRRPPGPPWWRRGEQQHPVRTQPAQQLNRQIGEQERQTGHVVAGVEDQQDVRVAVLDVPGRRGAAR